MTALFMKGMPSLLRTHAYHHVFDAATLLVAAVLVVLLVETEIERVRRADGSVDRAWLAATLPLAVVFAVVFAVRLHRFG